MIPKEIKNIVFDLGGVLLNLDMTLTRDAFLSLGLSDIDKVFKELQHNHILQDFEKGIITPHSFREAIRKYSVPDISDRSIDNAWNKMLLNFPQERMKCLINLKRSYRIFLLSNTNEIHIKAFQRYIGSTFSPGQLERVFEKTYYSNVIGMRKPDKEIFLTILERNKLKAQETWFIDDSPEHVEGAKKAGITSILLKQPKTILDLFPEYR